MTTTKASTTTPSQRVLGLYKRLISKTQRIEARGDWVKVRYHCEASTEIARRAGQDVRRLLSDWLEELDAGSLRQAGRRGSGLSTSERAALQLLEICSAYELMIDHVLWPVLEKDLSADDLKARVTAGITAAAKASQDKRTASKVYRDALIRSLWRELSRDGVPERHRPKRILVRLEEKAEGGEVYEGSNPPEVVSTCGLSTIREVVKPLRESRSDRTEASAKRRR